MITWLKVALGVGVLYLLSTRTKTGAEVVAAVKKCPAGTVSGPWFTCVAQCPQGWKVGTSDGSNSWLPAGQTYCYGGGSVDFAGTLGDIGDSLSGAVNPFTGQPFNNSTAATGVDGTTITVDPNGPITSPDDVRIAGNGNGISV